MDANVVLAGGERPFATEAAAKARLSALGYSDAEWDVKPHGDGFAVVKRTDAPAKPGGQGNPGDPAPQEPQEPDPMATPSEKYYRVKFHLRSDRNQAEDVILAVNGEGFQCRRNEVVVVPERIKCAADDAVTSIPKDVPGKDRKEDTEIQTYPYENLGEVTEADWMEFRTKMHEWIETHPS